MERGFFRNDDGLFCERSKFGVVREITPAERADGYEQRSQHEGSDGGDPQPRAGTGRGEYEQREAAQPETGPTGSLPGGEGKAGERVLVFRAMDNDGAVFPLDEAEVLAGFLVAGIAGERTAVIERGVAGGAGAVTGVADVIERVGGELLVVSGAEPELHGVVVFRGLVGF